LSLPKAGGTIALPGFNAGTGQVPFRRSDTISTLVAVAPPNRLVASDRALSQDFSI
jgi:hypothetical protein